MIELIAFMGGFYIGHLILNALKKNAEEFNAKDEEGQDEHAAGCLKQIVIAVAIFILLSLFW